MINRIPTNSLINKVFSKIRLKCRFYSLLTNKRLNPLYNPCLVPSVDLRYIMNTVVDGATTTRGGGRCELPESAHLIFLYIDRS